MLAVGSAEARGDAWARGLGLFGGVGGGRAREKHRGCSAVRSAGVRGKHRGCSAVRSAGARGKHQGCSAVSARGGAR